MKFIEILGMRKLEWWAIRWRRKTISTQHRSVTKADQHMKLRAANEPDMPHRVTETRNVVRMVNNFSAVHLLWKCRVNHLMANFNSTLRSTVCISWIQLQLEALGQCIHPPRHVLPVSQSIPDRHQNLITCSLAHYHPSLKISCKSVPKLLRKVANRQTNNDYISSYPNCKR